MTEYPCYTAAAVRELDRLAIEEHHIAGFELMLRAGTAALQALLKKWPDTRKLIIFCGTGNNGGDGFVMAALALNQGLKADIYLAGLPENITGDARKAMDFAINQHANIKPLIAAFSEFAVADAKSIPTIIVDALLGTGLSGKVREPCNDIIDLINSSTLPVTAIDIPSGLCSDTGEILGNAVKADLTVTFIGRKIGLYLAHGPEFSGEIVFDDLAVPDDIYHHVKPCPNINRGESL